MINNGMEENKGEEKKKKKDWPYLLKGRGSDLKVHGPVIHEIT